MVGAKSQSQEACHSVTRPKTSVPQLLRFAVEAQHMVFEARTWQSVGIVPLHIAAGVCCRRVDNWVHSCGTNFERERCPASRTPRTTGVTPTGVVPTLTRTLSGTVGTTPRLHLTAATVKRRKATANCMRTLALMRIERRKMRRLEKHCAERWRFRRQRRSLSR